MSAYIRGSHRLLHSSTQAHQPQCADSNGWAWSVRRQRRSCLRDVIDIHHSPPACYHNETFTRSTGELLQTLKLPPPDESPRRPSTPLYSAYLFPNIVQTSCVADQSPEVRPGVSDAGKARARVAAILILSNDDPRRPTRASLWTSKSTPTAD